MRKKKWRNEKSTLTREMFTLEFLYCKLNIRLCEQSYKQHNYFIMNVVIEKRGKNCEIIVKASTWTWPTSLHASRLSAEESKSCGWRDLDNVNVLLLCSHLRQWQWKRNSFSINNVHFIINSPWRRNPFEFGEVFEGFRNRFFFFGSFNTAAVEVKFVENVKFLFYGKKALGQKVTMVKHLDRNSKCVNLRRSRIKRLRHLSRKWCRHEPKYRSIKVKTRSLFFCVVHSHFQPPKKHISTSLSFSFLILRLLSVKKSAACFL